MKILCTCPGRHGDILWSLPAARALYEATGAAIDLLVSGKYSGVIGLVAEQPYIHAAYVADDWAVEETAPMTPWLAPLSPTLRRNYDHVFHLGYRHWPKVSLAHEHFDLLREQLAEQGRAETAACLTLDLDRPWLHRFPWVPHDPVVAVGFTDEWLELKTGVLLNVAHRLKDVTFYLLVPWQHSRWFHEYGGSGDGCWPKNVAVCPCDLQGAANLISAATVMLGCNSALSHIAIGLGVPVVMMEPASARHHPIFYPVGKTGPQVTLVTGNDGQPTFDARHVGDVIEQQRGRHHD